MNLLSTPISDFYLDCPDTDYPQSCPTCGGHSAWPYSGDCWPTETECSSCHYPLFIHEIDSDFLCVACRS